MSKVVDLTGLSRFWANVDKRKASIDGKYPDLMAGDLVGRGESVPAEFSFRASGGKSIKDGSAWIKMLKGNSVVWNQKNEKNVRLINGDNTQGSAQMYDTIGNELHYQECIGHKVYAIARCSDANVDRIYYTDNVQANLLKGAFFTASSSATQIGIVARIPIGFNVQNAEVDINFHDLTQMFGAGNEPTTIEEFYARKPIVEDEFAYNEGEVIHMTAEGIKSVGDNAWDEQWEVGGLSSDGEPSSVANRIRSRNYIEVLANEEYYSTRFLTIFFYDDEMRFLSYIDMNTYTFTTPSGCRYIKFYLYGTEDYNNDIMLTLVHSGWKQDTDAGYQPYWEDRLIFDQRIKDEFPNGMQKWDMVYNKNGRGYIVKGTGVVDLGTLNWELSEFNGHSAFFSEGNQLGAKYADGIFYLCAKYQSAEYRIFTEGLDKSIALNNGYYGNVEIKDFIIIRDTSYTDAASFKAAMAGVLLYYELAEPTIIEYDEPFNLDYKVADFGTEQAIAETNSAPISADIIYQFNAVDMIREHELEINELQSIIATMQAQLASLTSNNG